MALLTTALLTTALLTIALGDPWQVMSDERQRSAGLREEERRLRQHERLDNIARV